MEACLGLKIIKEGSGDGRGERQSIRVIYDKGKMLQLAAYSPNYALKRAEDRDAVGAFRRFDRAYGKRGVPARLSVGPGAACKMAG